MAFRVSKADDKRLDELAKALDQSPLQAAVDEYNAALAAAREKLEAAAGAYNAARDVAREAVEALRDQFKGEFDDHSETWQEGERGQEAAGLIEALEEALGKLEEDLEFEFPDELSLEGAEDLAAVVNEMPREPQS